MSKKNVLLIYGGGATEHDVSIVSAKYLKDQIDTLQDYHVHSVEINKEGKWLDQNNNTITLNMDGKLVTHKNQQIKIDVAIPCLHGYPGETGDIQSLFTMAKIPFLGCDAEASSICFNKITTKLWLDALNIPNTPYIFLHQFNAESLQKAQDFFHKNPQGLFVKAASQGSSVGCYKAENLQELEESLKNAFDFSRTVLLEKKVQGRELEVSVYQWQGKIICSDPGEIVLPEQQFYTYEEKYSKKSKTKTIIKAQGLGPNEIDQIKLIAQNAFEKLHLRHLARVDFFLEGKNIYLNEINTFPGMTPISMFPKMMEENGHCFRDFLQESLAKLA